MAFPSGFSGVIPNSSTSSLYAASKTKGGGDGNDNKNNPVKRMTLVKTKIVVDKNGTTCYLWKKVWWILGYWYPYGNTSRQIDSFWINDDTVSECLFTRFLTSKYVK